jgi:hypothetical protein
MLVKEYIQLGLKVNPQDVTDTARVMQVEAKDLATFINQQIYRQEYNAKPEVQAKRRQYNQQRNQLIKQVREALKRNPDLLKGE